MKSHKIVPIALDNLLIDLSNPRYDPRTSQQEALKTISRDQGIKLFNLAEDIFDKGLNPSELTMVAPTEEKGLFLVLEGNRRVAALKIVSSPSQLSTLGLSQEMVRRYESLYERVKDDLPKQLDCVILSREDANYWILLKHTGENEGRGVVNWDGRARQRFRGSSPALQAVELVESCGYLNEETTNKLPKIAITNIERILNTPDARKHLGVDVRNNQLILTSSDDKEALGRLTFIVSDVANRHIKVTDLDSKEQRVAYAEEVASRPLPSQPAPAKPKAATVGMTRTGSGKPGRRISPERNTLIPSHFRLAIPQLRINRIYHELQRLKLDQFVNSSAVLFRVFVELSIDDFARRKKIILKVPIKSKSVSVALPRMRDMTLREKMKCIVDYCQSNGLCSKDELRGARALIANRDHVLSVDSLNAYVHNMHYNPTPSDLKTNWDNIQIFIERIWKS